MSGPGKQELAKLRPRANGRAEAKAEAKAKAQAKEKARVSERNDGVVIHVWGEVTERVLVTCHSSLMAQEQGAALQCLSNTIAIQLARPAGSRFHRLVVGVRGSEKGREKGVYSKIKSTYHWWLAAIF